MDLVKKMQKIEDMSPQLKRQQIKEILDFIMKNEDKSILQQGNDGVRVRMENMKHTTINKIYSIAIPKDQQ